MKISLKDGAKTATDDTIDIELTVFLVSDYSYGEDYTVEWFCILLIITIYSAVFFNTWFNPADVQREFKENYYTLFSLLFVASTLFLILPPYIKIQTDILYIPAFIGLVIGIPFFKFTVIIIETCHEMFVQMFPEPRHHHHHDFIYDPVGEMEDL